MSDALTLALWLTKATALLVLAMGLAATLRRPVAPQSPQAPQAPIAA